MTLRRALLRAVGPLLEHPGPSTRALQRCVALVLIDGTLTGIRWGNKLWPTD